MDRSQAVALGPIEAHLRIWLIVLSLAHEPTVRRSLIFAAIHCWPCWIERTKNILAGDSLTPGYAEMWPPRTGFSNVASYYSTTHRVLKPLLGDVAHIVRQV